MNNNSFSVNDLLVALCHNAPFYKITVNFAKEYMQSYNKIATRIALLMWDKLIILSKNFLLHCTNQSSLYGVIR